MNPAITHLKKRALHWPIFSLFCSLLVAGPSLAAPGIGDISIFDPTAFLSDQIPQSVADATIKTAGFYTCHRPYQGATSISNYNSLDLLLETTLMKIGDDLPKALSSNDGFYSQTTTDMPALPVAQIHIRKGFSPSFDVGISGLVFKTVKIYGGDAKIVLYDPEEGPSFALRLGYTYFDVPLLYVSGHTWNPEVVMSRKLSFAEPYLGAGFRYSLGEISIPLSYSGFETTATKSGSGMGEYLFTGVYFRILGAQGFRLGMEGSFDFTGFHTIGMVFGIGF